MSPEVERHSFAAMGDCIDVQVPGGDDDLARAVQRVFEDHEAVLSSRRRDSELCSLNAAPATPFQASPLLFDAVSESLAWACVTDGVFDPTLLADRTAARPRQAARAGGAVAVLTRPKEAAGRWRQVQLDFERETISIPAGTAIDLDDFGKAYTVDHAIAAIGTGANALVSASGSRYAAGDGPGGLGWHVTVRDALGARAYVCALNVNDRGVATVSSEQGRDCGDGRAVEGDLAGVTVIALTATQANVLSKAVLRLGSDAGLRLIERFDAAECVAVTRFGELLTTSGLSEYLA